MQKNRGMREYEVASDFDNNYEFNRGCIASDVLYINIFESTHFAEKNLQRK